MKREQKEFVTTLRVSVDILFTFIYCHFYNKCYAWHCYLYVSQKKNKIIKKTADKCEKFFETIFLKASFTNHTG